jgi:hypothetical protein
MLGNTFSTSFAPQYSFASSVVVEICSIRGNLIFDCPNTIGNISTHNSISDAPLINIPKASPINIPKASPINIPHVLSINIPNVSSINIPNVLL